MNDLERFDPGAWLEEKIFVSFRPRLRPARPVVHRAKPWPVAEFISAASIALSTLSFAVATATYADPVARSSATDAPSVPPELAHDYVPPGYWEQLRARVSQLPRLPVEADDVDVPDLWS